MMGTLSDSLKNAGARNAIFMKIQKHAWITGNKFFCGPFSNGEELAESQ